MIVFRRNCSGMYLHIYNHSNLLALFKNLLLLLKNDVSSLLQVFSWFITLSLQHLQTLIFLQAHQLSFLLRKHKLLYDAVKLPSTFTGDSFQQQFTNTNPIHTVWISSWLLPEVGNKSGTMYICKEGTLFNAMSSVCRRPFDYMVTRKRKKPPMGRRMKSVPLMVLDGKVLSTSFQGTRSVHVIYSILN